ncbi:hypothetical protein N7494_005392 [Penicillium frequentans]|uniref:Uncharacterized protein n=1 Tax=Penicillium frequentans TaxID=3151616 RepID=A0AAD6GFD6_9EURO|nr:hypothetical protein N7494_005392 [Penicillium glabrum]
MQFYLSTRNSLCYGQQRKAPPYLNPAFAVSAEEFANASHRSCLRPRSVAQNKMRRRKAEVHSVRGNECVYSQTKQGKERTQLESANSEVERYEELLREIFHEIDTSVARKITKALVCLN